MFNTFAVRYLKKKIKRYSKHAKRYSKHEISLWINFTDKILFITHDFYLSVFEEEISQYTRII